MGSNPVFILPRPQFQDFLDYFRKNNFQIVAPVEGNGVLSLGEITRVEELPIGFRDEQNGNNHRVFRGEAKTLFGFNLTREGFKEWLFPALSEMWRSRISETGFEVIPRTDQVYKWAFLGIRSCELSALSILDQVFLERSHRDAHYSARRKNLFVVAVQCTVSTGNCFCHSLGTGPSVSQGFDLALIEIYRSPEDHFFIVEAGSSSGERVCLDLGLSSGDQRILAIGRTEVDHAARSQVRSLAPELPAVVQGELENSIWGEIGQRCTACGDCTRLCPTCFCHSVGDEPMGNGAFSRVRRWSTCFDPAFMSLKSGPLQGDIAHRYRQWFTHKFSTWVDQFEVSGCVGCGRCITFCPDGIDVTDIARRLSAGGN